MDNQHLTDPHFGLIEAIFVRRSVRGFLPKEIPAEILDRIFEISQRAPSNCNVQPWKVFVAKGELRNRLSRSMIAELKSGSPSVPDYPDRGDFFGEYRKRQIDCAVALYASMGIERFDKAGRQHAIERNFEFFGAPYIAFIGMDKAFGTTVALDVGMYAQNLMLTLVAFGLHSCPVATMRAYPHLVREAFGLPHTTQILFGIAFGYEDPSVAANNTRTVREYFKGSVIIKDN